MQDLQTRATQATQSWRVLNGGCDWSLGEGASTARGARALPGSRNGVDRLAKARHQFPAQFSNRETFSHHRHRLSAGSGPRALRGFFRRTGRQRHEPRHVGKTVWHAATRAAGRAKGQSQQQGGRERARWRLLPCRHTRFHGGRLRRDRRGSSLAGGEGRDAGDQRRRETRSRLGAAPRRHPEGKSAGGPRDRSVVCQRRTPDSRALPELRPERPYF